jgi:hypothetical protein
MPRRATETTHPIWQIPGAGSGAAVLPAAVPSAPTAVALGVGIAAAVFAPWLVHLVPAEGPPLGPVLLPMFYAPLLAAVLLRLPLAVAIGALTPVVSRLLTGLPADPVLTGLVLQVALFVVGVRLLRRARWALVAPAAYLIALATTAVVTAVVPGPTAVDFAGTLATGWPGVVIIAGIGLAADRTLR